ncbi:MAG: hypothetical protein ACLU7D_01705, partial [Collinsella sp.]
ELNIPGAQTRRRGLLIIGPKCYLGHVLPSTTFTRVGPTMERFYNAARRLPACGFVNANMAAVADALG